MVQSRFPDQKPNSDLTFGTNLNRSARLWRTVFRALAGLQARPTSYITVLNYLITGADGATQKELATLMGADAPTVVRVLDALEREGVVERRVRPADRRSKSVHFTKSGEAFAQAFRRAGEQTSANLLAGCDPADLEAAVRVFRRISENAECVTFPDKAVI